MDKCKTFSIRNTRMCTYDTMKIVGSLRQQKGGQGSYYLPTSVDRDRVLIDADHGVAEDLGCSRACLVLLPLWIAQINKNLIKTLTILVLLVRTKRIRLSNNFVDTQN